MSEFGDYKGLDKFGKLLIWAFKDELIKHAKSLFTGQDIVPSRKGLQNKLEKLDHETQELITDVMTHVSIMGMYFFVDRLIKGYDFRRGIIENPDADYGIEAFCDGINVVELAEEDLRWELFGEEGWEARFSEYPTSDQILEKYNSTSDSNERD